MNLFLHFFHIKRILQIFKFIFFIEGLKKYKKFNGRANRSEYWYFMLYWIIFYLLVIALENCLNMRSLDFSKYSFSKYIPLFNYYNKVGVLTLLYRPVTILPSLCILVRRLHDRNISGWWSCLLITPLGILLVIPLVLKGDMGDNKYGPSSNNFQY